MSTKNLMIALTTDEKDDFLPPPLWQQLNELGVQLFWYRPDEVNEIGWEALFEQTQAEVLMTGWESPPLPNEVPVESIRPKYLCHLPGSVRKVVPRSWIEAGLQVTNWGGSVSHIVAECGLMLMLEGVRRSGYWNLRMHHSGAWKGSDLDTRSLFGKRVGIHGFGAIARQLVRLLIPFGLRIQTYSPSIPNSLLEEFNVTSVDSLETLFSVNDVIVELAPLTPETIGTVTESLLRMIPEGGVFVNIGRGAVVDEKALARVCAEGRLYACLDVYTEEPLPADSPLRRLDNVVLLPHTGGPTVDQRKTAGAFGVHNVERYLRGLELESTIDLEIYDSAT